MLGKKDNSGFIENPIHLSSQIWCFHIAFPDENILRKYGSEKINIKKYCQKMWLYRVAPSVGWNTDQRAPTPL